MSRKAPMAMPSSNQKAICITVTSSFLSYGKDGKGSMLVPVSVVTVMVVMVLVFQPRIVWLNDLNSI